jgi:hypothetical protein
MPALCRAKKKATKESSIKDGTSQAGLPGSLAVPDRIRTRQTSASKSSQVLTVAVAQYCGTSLAMIQADYCGTLGLAGDQTIFEPQAANPMKNLVAGPGFEPGTSRL